MTYGKEGHLQKQKLARDKSYYKIKLRNLRPYEYFRHIYQQEKLGKNDVDQLGQLYWARRTNKMQKLRKEIEFLERGMQRDRTRLSRVQQDPL